MVGGLNNLAYYQAIFERNKKYDGIFYFAARPTGLYCRPSCPAPHNIREKYFFFDSPQKAKLKGFVACTRCHPDRLKNDMSVEILSSINAGVINDEGVHGLADLMHISERHLRRIVQARTGTSPSQLNQTKRLAVARRLILQTKLPITDIAFIAGFSSLRQFNAVFKDAFKIAPREMRKAAALTRQQLNNR